MIENLPEDKLEALIERVVSKSHMAIAKVQSNGLGDVYKRLGAIEVNQQAMHDTQLTQTEIMRGMLRAQDETTVTNKERNGRIGTLEACNLENRSSFKTAMWLGSLLITTIISLSLYIYHSELAVVVKASDGVKTMLVEHIKKSDEILNSINNK